MAKMAGYVELEGQMTAFVLAYFGAVGRHRGGIIRRADP